MIVGVDEVGYGSWAGPVVVCGFLIKKEKTFPFRDSKVLTAKKRSVIFQEILSLYKKGEVDFCLSFGPVSSIVSKGILPTTLQCMTSVIEYFKSYEPLVCIDGRNGPSQCSVPFKTIIRGDETVDAISAASIVAKVIRDHYMDLLSVFYPAYSWDKNKGYGTLAHRNAIQKHGVSKEHRVNYKPLQCFT